MRLTYILQVYYKTIHKSTNELIICHVGRDVDSELAQRSLKSITGSTFLQELNKGPLSAVDRYV